MDGLDLLFETDFIHCQLMWPHAEIGCFFLGLNPHVGFRVSEFRV
jgi:hypothetical protein